MARDADKIAAAASGGASDPAGPIKAKMGGHVGEGAWKKDAGGGWSEDGTVEMAPKYAATKSKGSEYAGEDTLARFRGNNGVETTADGRNITMRTKYLDEAGRTGMGIGSSDGKLTGEDGKALSTAGGRSTTLGASGDSHIYAMDAGGTMLTADAMKHTGIDAADPTKASVFHHSSFFAGGDVAAAGEISTNSEGYVKSVSNRSGHYKPGADNLVQALDGLDRQGVNLDAAKADFVSPDSSSKSYNAGAFLQSNGNTKLLDQRSKVMKELLAERKPVP